MQWKCSLRNLPMASRLASLMALGVPPFCTQNRSIPIPQSKNMLNLQRLVIALFYNLGSNISTTEEAKLRYEAYRSASKFVRPCYHRRWFRGGRDSLLGRWVTPTLLPPFLQSPHSLDFVEAPSSMFGEEEGGEVVTHSKNPNKFELWVCSLRKKIHKK